MGRKRGKRRRGDGEGTWDAPIDNEKATRCTARFEKYYRKQLVGSVLQDDEFERMMAAMERPLPVTLRLTGDAALTSRLEAELVEAVGKTNAALACSQEPLITTPIVAAKLPWIERGWHLNVGRMEIRKCPEAAELLRWLVGHSNGGTTTRQEAVSMVPPLFLGVAPGDVVLDACAAPGSKTTQLIEAVDGSNQGGRDGVVAALERSSLVVANDEHYQRTHTLVHQLKRLGSASWVATHCDAGLIPTIYKSVTPGVRTRRPENRLDYDKVLCDVPCSSDGTLRKNSVILRRWTCANGNALHALQARIATRVGQTLAPGGRMVYSTCSMNPVEDEAVVAAVLRSDPELRVVDDNSLPDLKRRQGLDHWTVYVDADDDDLVAECEADDDRPRSKKQLRPTLFPPTDANDPGRVVRDQLKRCMRFVPHDQDTGAFFVAVLERPPKAESVQVPETVAEAVASSEPLSASSPKAKWIQEDADFVPLADVADVPQLVDFYGLQGFPVDLLVARATGDDGDASKKVLVVSRAVRSIVLRAKQIKLRVVHAGVVIFQRTSLASGSSTLFRLVQDGVNILVPFMTKRLVRVPQADFQRLLKGGTVPFSDLSDLVADFARAIDVGSLVCVLDMPNHSDPPVLVTWRSPGPFLTVYCNKTDLVPIASRFAALTGLPSDAFFEGADGSALPDEDDAQKDNDAVVLKDDETAGVAADVRSSGEEAAAQAT